MALGDHVITSKIILVIMSENHHYIINIIQSNESSAHNSLNKQRNTIFKEIMQLKFSPNHEKILFRH